MATRYVNIDRDTALLLPPDLRDWVPADHLVHFVIDAVEQLDVRTARTNERGTGSEQYPPRMLLGLLIYSYATGTFSSRQIERASYENVAVRLLCADTHPDHDTLCTFRKENGALLGACFAQVLELAAGCGVLKVGGITVAIDGTKVLANASKHAAVSYEHADKTMRQLDLEIAQLLRKAQEADATPLADGLTIPVEVQRRQERKAQLARARAEMEARAYARFQGEQAEHAAKMAAREAKAAAGEKPRGRPPEPPDATPGPKDQYNFTDPESRIMKAGSGDHFEQAYNAQAAVEVDSRLIVGQRVSTAPNDKQQLVPTVQAIVPAVGPVQEVLIDSGFVSEAAVRAVEVDARGQPTGLTVLAALQREAHGRTVEQLERRPDPLAPASGAPFAERMNHRTATAAGRIRYKLRQQTVEPTFGIIKEVLGFRRFSLRGEANAALEWTLVSLAFNLKRLHTLGAHLAPA
jgi:transposase